MVVWARNVFERFELRTRGYQRFLSVHALVEQSSSVRVLPRVRDTFGTQGTKSKKDQTYLVLLNPCCVQSKTKRIGKHAAESFIV